MIAKVLDLFSMGGFIALGTHLSDSAVIGFICGAAYLLVGDGLGASWKSWFKLQTIDVRTGAACRVSQSAMRNIPWLVAPCLRTITHHLYEPDDAIALLLRGVAGFVGLAIAIVLIVGFKRDGRHAGDLFAGTAVTAKIPGE